MGNKKGSMRWVPQSSHHFAGQRFGANKTTDYFKTTDYLRNGANREPGRWSRSLAKAFFSICRIRSRVRLK
ncbi:MAG: hypothetical protein KatS3mg111_0364 [Pirellulaceae bacterium]|nr:MAG: hypothetical protein KatS3mg111_0364 [Pirellulaceae bacterium]